MKCEVCGHGASLKLFAGRVLCKRCYLALPRQRCAAKARTGRRCNRTAVGEGVALCPHHAGAQALTWVVCEKCGEENQAGGPCKCEQTRPRAIEVRITGEGAATLRRLKSRFPGLLYGEIVARALSVYERSEGIDDD
jgi:hypothetical protein